MTRFVFLVLSHLLLASTASSENLIRKCASDGIEDAYLGRDVPGLTPELIAGTFVTQPILEREDEALLRYWVLMEPSDLPVADRVSEWKGSDADKAAVLGKSSLIGLLRQTYRTIARHEGGRMSPEEAADVLARQSAAAESDLITVEGYREEFLSLVDSYVTNDGAPPYGAALLAAQIMRNRLDIKRGVSERAVNAIEPRFQMPNWDTWLRKSAVRSELEVLLGQPGGEAMWNEFLIHRMTTIGCAGAAIPTNADQIPTDQSGSAYLKSCVATPLNTAQCECLADIGEKALPEIRHRAYSRRETIALLLERNPVLKAVLATECGINSY